MVNTLSFSPLLSKWIAAPWNLGSALQLRRFTIFCTPTIRLSSFQLLQHLTGGLFGLVKYLGIALLLYLPDNYSTYIPEVRPFKEKDEAARTGGGGKDWARYPDFLSFQSKDVKWDRNSKTCAVLAGVIRWSQTHCHAHTDWKHPWSLHGNWNKAPETNKEKHLLDQLPMTHVWELDVRCHK